MKIKLSFHQKLSRQWGVPHTHQAEAIRICCQKKGNSRPALVISSGTGSGKTESFLLPALNDIWDTPRIPGGGMRCLILYPMNALVSDQVSRVYELLKGQDKISVFHFTSGTPEDTRNANKIGEQVWESCRKRSRQQARGLEDYDGKRISEDQRLSVPDIVITNYSMLEYMLCRPQDQCFFGPDLRCIILDEAHLYSGVLAAEIALLLRRVYDRCGVEADNVLHVATSATLGGDDDDLKDFARKIFSSDPKSTFPIRGRKASSPFFVDLEGPESPDLLQLQDHFGMEVSTIVEGDNEALISNDQETVEHLAKPIKLLVSDNVLAQASKVAGANPAVFLRKTLERSPFIRKMSNVLAEAEIISLPELSARIWDNRNDDGKMATTLLLRLSAAAREDLSLPPLIPHRLHFLVSTPQGISICLNPECEGPSSHKSPPLGTVQSQTDICPHCGSRCLAVWRCRTCGEWFLVAREDFSSGRAMYVSAEQRTSSSSIIFLQPAKEDEVTLVVKRDGSIGGAKSAGIGLRKVADTSICPVCNSPSELCNNDTKTSTGIGPLNQGGRLGLSVFAETVLHGLPEYPGESRKWKPARGRRLLCFSDSRSEAARLGPSLTIQHQNRVIRAAIVDTLSNLSNPVQYSDLLREYQELKEGLKDLPEGKAVRVAVEKQIWEKEQNLAQFNQGFSFDTIIQRLKEHPLFSEVFDQVSGDKHTADQWRQSTWEENGRNVRDRTEAMFGLEFDLPLVSTDSIEGIGLIEIVYPGLNKIHLSNDILGQLGVKHISPIEENWTKILAVLLDTVRSDQCIGWSRETDSRSWGDDYVFQKRWMTVVKEGWGTVPFIGDTLRQRRINFISRILHELGCPDGYLLDNARLLLNHAFNQLLEKSGEEQRDGELRWLRRKDQQVDRNQTAPAIQILFDHLSFRYPLSLFFCEDTLTLWPRNVIGFSPLSASKGHLRQISHEEADQDPRFGRPRGEVKTSGVFRIGLWAEEHSAQVGENHRGRLQNLFKEGVRNILSCTTTLELGIDIGGLNGVLMANVPPSLANYRQRAGRAGRRSDGSAVVATYVRSRPFDRAVFNDFGTFLDCQLPKPVVHLDRKQIVGRHLRSYLFSTWIKQYQPDRVGAMNAFGKMGPFLGITPPPIWPSHLTKPEWDPKRNRALAEDFTKYLEHCMSPKYPMRDRCIRIVKETPLEYDLSEDNDWTTFIENTKQQFESALGEWWGEIKPLIKSWEIINDCEAISRSIASSIRHQVAARCEMTLIDWFASKKFLPRFGFPINLLKLLVLKSTTRNRPDIDDKFKLERQSVLALREYVPESEVIVSGKRLISRGINRHWTGQDINTAIGIQRYACECAEGHVTLHTDPNEPCGVKGCEAGLNYAQKLFFPIQGFLTAAWDPPRIGRTVETVGNINVTSTDFLDKGEDLTIERFGGITDLQARYKPEAKLLVRNTGNKGFGFAVCTKCGFSMSEFVSNGKGKLDVPQRFINHASLYTSNIQSRCWANTDEAPIIRNMILAAEDTTEMVVFTWPRRLEDDERHSLAAALALGGTGLLQVDSRQLGVIADNQWGFIVYDTTPGGSGHCFELYKRDTEWIEAAQKILKGSHDHDSRCERACIECILSFGNQFQQPCLNRKSALKLIG